MIKWYLTVKDDEANETHLETSSTDWREIINAINRYVARK